MFANKPPPLKNGVWIFKGGFICWPDVEKMQKAKVGTLEFAPKRRENVGGPNPSK